ncbi:hypothetical protein D3C87_1912700 [compost metagenome]
MKAFTANQKTALAQGRVTGRFIGGVAIDQHFTESRAQAFGVVAPAHRLGWRTDAAQVRRLAGNVGRQMATAFSHDAQAAEAKDFDGHRAAGGDLAHLRQG